MSRYSKTEFLVKEEDKTTIRVWKPRGSYPGHVSVELHGKYACYISAFPAERLDSPNDFKIVSTWKKLTRSVKGQLRMKGGEDDGHKRYNHIHENKKYREYTAKKTQIEDEDVYVVVLRTLNVKTMFALAKKFIKYNFNTRVGKQDQKQLKWSLLGNVFDMDPLNESCASLAQRMLVEGGINELLTEDRWSIKTRACIGIIIAGLSASPWLSWDKAEDGRLNHPGRDIGLTVITFIILSTIIFIGILLTGNSSYYSETSSKIVSPAALINLLRKARRMERTRYKLSFSKITEEQEGKAKIDLILDGEGCLDLEENEKALRHFQRAATLGYPLSYLRLGIFYSKIPEEKAEKEYWLRKAQSDFFWLKKMAESDLNPQYLNYLGAYYKIITDNERIDYNTESGFYIAEEEIKESEVSQVSLGEYKIVYILTPNNLLIFIDKIAGKPNAFINLEPSMSLHIRKQAANLEMTDTETYYPLEEYKSLWDTLYSLMSGKKLAFQCFQKAANRGLIIAFFNLAMCYEEGVGVEKDKGKAVFWYTKAAVAGLHLAQFNLGIMYESQGDEKEAKNWYAKAAAKRHIEDYKQARVMIYTEEKEVNNSDKLIPSFYKQSIINPARTSLSLYSSSTSSSSSSSSSSSIPLGLD